MASFRCYIYFGMQL